MKKNSYMFYSDFFKGKKITNETVLISKNKSSYLLGPLLNNNFDASSFRKRVLSNSIYSLKIYKKCIFIKCKKIINTYQNQLSDNEVLEIFKDGKVVKHRIIKVPGD